MHDIHKCGYIGSALLPSSVTVTSQLIMFLLSALWELAFPTHRSSRTYSPFLHTLSKEISHERPSGWKTFQDHLALNNERGIIQNKRLNVQTARTFVVNHNDFTCMISCLTIWSMIFGWHGSNGWRLFHFPYPYRINVPLRENVLFYRFCTVLWARKARKQNYLRPYKATHNVRNMNYLRAHYSRFENT